MDTAESPITRCLDCGQDLHGRYCSRCGQRHGGHGLGLKHVVEEALHDLTHFDARLFTTLRFLFLRPGQLTLEFLGGRRTRYLPPFRLYIFISFVLFLLLGTGGKATVKLNIKDSPGVVTLNGTAMPAPEGREESPLAHGARKAMEDPQAFREHFLHWSSRIMFVLLPAFAALLLLMFMGARRYFVEHVIFSLHFHSFAFGLFIVQWALAHVPWGPVQFAGDFLFLALPVHLGLAMKRVYGDPVWKILLKGALLSAIYLILVAAALVGTVFWVLRH